MTERVRPPVLYATATDRGDGLTRTHRLKAGSRHLTLKTISPAPAKGQCGTVRPALAYGLGVVGDRRPGRPTSLLFIRAAHSSPDCGSLRSGRCLFLSQFRPMYHRGAKLAGSLERWPRSRGVSCCFPLPSPPGIRGRKARRVRRFRGRSRRSLYFTADRPPHHASSPTMPGLYVRCFVPDDRSRRCRWRSWPTPGSLVGLRSVGCGRSHPRLPLKRPLQSSLRTSVRREFKSSGSRSKTVPRSEPKVLDKSLPSRKAGLPRFDLRQDPFKVQASSLCTA